MKNTFDISDVATLVRHLVREELKSRRLGFTFLEFGAAETPLLAQLNGPITRLIQLNTDEDFFKYDSIMNEHARKVKADDRSIERETKAVMVKLGLL